MTAKYELTKLYRTNQEIKVTEVSLEAFKAGLSDTLEHLVIYHGQEVKVACKPKVLDYQNYKPISQSDFFYILPQDVISTLH